MGINISKELVTVIMPVYNCERYVAKAIESILSQTYGHIELIILNDGSTDHSEAVIKNFKDRRIIYYKGERNTGKVGIVNAGLSMVSGDYITMQDADDWSEPNRIEKQVDALKRSSAVIVFTGYNLIGYTKHGKKYRTKDEELRDEFVNSGFLSHGEFVPTICATMMITREVLNKAGGYSNYFRGRFGEDIFWIYKIMRHGQALTIPHVLYNYLYNRPGSYTNDLQNIVKPQHLYGFELVARIIDLYEQTGIDVLKEYSQMELLQLELDVCQQSYTKSTQKYLSQIEELKNSTSYKIGRRVICPISKLTSLFSR